MRLLARLREVIRRRRLEQDLDAEFQFHASMRESKYRAEGLPVEEARSIARREFGNATVFKEVCRELSTFASLERFWQDIRYAQRMLRKNPAITVAAVLSLALGIGANAAMFSIVNGILLRPLAFQDPDRLVRVTGAYPPGAVVAITERSRTMDFSAFTRDSEFSLTGQGEPVHLIGSKVSANIFGLLSVAPELGRLFRPGEDRPGQDRIVMLSHAFWQTKFNGEGSVIGRLITIDGVTREIVGVMPPLFDFPSSQVQLWVPLHLNPSNEVEFWDTEFMPMIARLRTGATLAQAQQEIRSLIAEVLPIFPYKMARSWNADATATPLQGDIVGNVQGKLVILLSAVGFVLLIACANVASLLLSLSSARRKEMALRASLGASRARIIRQLLTESVLLAFVGAGLGLAMAFEGLQILKSAFPANTPRLVEVAIDWRVLLFVTALAVITGLIFGLAPALNTLKINLAGSIKAGGQRSTGAGGVRLRSLLTAGEVALSVVLLIGAGLLIKSLWVLTQVNPGFNSGHVLTLRVFPNRTICRERSSCVAFYDDLLRRAARTEGVLDAAVTNDVPMSGQVPIVPVEVEGHPGKPGDGLDPLLWGGAVSPGFFRVLGIPILQGRGFTESDTEKSDKVIVVNAATARLYWPGENPIGKHIRVVFENTARRVVGVAGDVRQYDLAGNSPNWVRGAMYMPYAQSVAQDKRLPSTMSLLVKTVVNPVNAGRELRALVMSREPNVPISEVQTLDSVVSSSTAGSRSMMWMFAAFAAAALILAAIGTYGVISYSVSQRTYEMGVRFALGATKAGIFGMVLGQSFRLVLAGLAVGVAISFGLTRLLGRYLYGVTATDPITFLVVAGLLVGTALIAGYVPAIRASRVEPLTALRVD